MKIGTLNVGIHHSTSRNNGKHKTLTTIFIRMGEMVIADRTTWGRWTTAQALKEFKRFPERFQPRKGWDAATIKAIAA